MSRRTQYTYELLCDVTFSVEQWHAVNMFMDYCNNLGITGEELISVEKFPDKILLHTTEVA